MKTSVACLILLVSLIVVFHNQAFAIEPEDVAVIRCRGGLISIGDSRFSVMEKCGKPTYEQDDGNVWIYDYGPEEFVRYITFVADTVERLQVGGYGKER